MSKRVKILAVVIVAVAVVILAYALLTPQTDADSTDHMGMWGSHSYDYDEDCCPGRG
jgi:hypothetical protein